MTRTQIYRLTAMAASLLFGAALAPAQTIVAWGGPDCGDSATGHLPGHVRRRGFVLGLNIDVRGRRRRCYVWRPLAAARPG